MVKNIKGGKKSKNLARKNIGVQQSFKYEDLIKTDEQEYAKVLKINGGNRYNLLCYDKINRLGISRGSINRTRVEIGTIVLISKRGYQDNKCDILHIYNSSEVRVLIEHGDIDEVFAELNESNNSNDLISFGEKKEESDDEVNFEDL